MKKTVNSLVLFLLILLCGIYILFYSRTEPVELTKPYIEIPYDDDTE